MPGAPREQKPVEIPRLMEDANLLVVNKPAGVPAIDSRGSVEDLLNRAGRKWIPVHRLDKETTGCLLFAASEEIKDAMVRQFKEQKVGKVYEAVVVGRLERSDFSIRAPLDGMSAITAVRQIVSSPRATLIRVEIETGRTHQIRRHLSGIGHPLVGDKTYSGKLKVDPDIQQCPRQLLHAREITFAHPVGGRPVKITSPRPADFTQWIRKLGLAPT
jgi:23S rRNA pseudouridine1911/1915/1917 synthase